MYYYSREDESHDVRKCVCVWLDWNNNTYSHFQNMTMTSSRRTRSQSVREFHPRFHRRCCMCTDHSVRDLDTNYTWTHFQSNTIEVEDFPSATRRTTLKRRTCNWNMKTWNDWNSRASRSNTTHQSCFVRPYLKSLPTVTFLKYRRSDTLCIIPTNLGLALPVAIPNPSVRIARNACDSSQREWVFYIDSEWVSVVHGEWVSVVCEWVSYVFVCVCVWVLNMNKERERERERERVEILICK